MFTVNLATSVMPGDQIPWSGIAFCRDRHCTQQENPVSIRTFAVVALIAGGVTGIVQGAVNKLDQATAQQCLTRDWPAHQHATHMDFCTSYGYPTN